MDGDWCAIHGHEPLPENYYKICGECLHCWPTREEFLADVQKNLADMANVPVEWGPMPPRAATDDDEHVCPLCTHNF